MRVPVQRCSKSIETIRNIRDGEPRTATSTFTQLLSCAQETGVSKYRLLCESYRRPGVSKYRLLCQSFT